MSGSGYGDKHDTQRRAAVGYFHCRHQLYIIYNKLGLNVYLSPGNEHKDFLRCELSGLCLSAVMCFRCLAAESRLIKAINCSVRDGRGVTPIPQVHISWAGYTMFSIQREFITVQREIYLVDFCWKCWSAYLCVSGCGDEHGVCTATIPASKMSQ